ncbi:NAD(P)/FAD-dependent oxidoreductase [bacterium]|nr:NAD(P)/FAD-dependent oxidoreductase [bacterium]
MHYVIIGSGASGLKAAATLRENDCSGRLTLISRDLWPFYLKPVLADFIANRIDSKKLSYYSTAQIEQMDIEIITGRRVSAIVPEENSIHFSDGSVLDYQFLLIATGARPVIPARKQEYVSTFRCLNSLSDAVRIKNETQRSNKALVLGGGHYALEILRALHNLKFDLTFLTDERYFWDADHPIPADRVKDKLMSEKIDLRFNVDVVDVIDLDGESYRVVTNDGSVIDTQLILYAPLFEPNLDFIKDSSIEYKQGILVREDLRTNIPNIFACGDVAQFYDLNKGINRINFGWVSACKQGEIAALNMIGRDNVYISVKEEYFRELYGQELLTRW